MVNIWLIYLGKWNHISLTWMKMNYIRPFESWFQWGRTVRSLSFTQNNQIWRISTKISDPGPESTLWTNTIELWAVSEEIQQTRRPANTPDMGFLCHKKSYHDKIIDYSRVSNDIFVYFFFIFTSPLNSQRGFLSVDSVDSAEDGDFSTTTWTLFGSEDLLILWSSEALQSS